MRHFLRKSCWKSSLQVYFWLNIIFFFRFCWNWEGDIDSSEEFEFSECTCELQDHAQSRCTKWRCYEKGIHYVRPNIVFSALGVLVAWPIFFCISPMYLQRRRIRTFTLELRWCSRGRLVVQCMLGSGVYDNCPW